MLYITVDPCGTVKTYLLDNMFHRRVLAPAMTSLSLEGTANTAAAALFHSSLAVVGSLSSGRL
jgi:hypothetical protein